MARVLKSPAKYVQGKDILAQMEEHFKELGENVFVIVDPVVADLFAEQIKAGLANMTVKQERFQGECSKAEINRLQQLAEENGSEIIIGIGGGKTLDTAKAVSYYSKLPVVIVPTIAATDAPCSALAVIYSETGVFEKYLFLDQNPDVVLVDTKVVAQAPERFLISGMGDALATYFEAAACAQTRTASIAGGSQTLTAVKLAELCYNTLLEYGRDARKAAAAGAVTEALEKIVEANTLLSGIGFESGGLAAAHAIHNGLTVLEATHTMTHGEKVAFSTLVQLVLEDRSPAEIKQVTEFCRDLGLPTNLADLGVKEIDEAEIMQVAEASCAEDDTMHNMPFPVTAEMVKDAILAVDNY